MSRENRLPVVLKNLLTAARAFSLFAEYPFYRYSFWAPRLQFWERDVGAPELLQFFVYALGLKSVVAFRLSAEACSLGAYIPGLSIPFIN